VQKEFFTSISRLRSAGLRYPRLDVVIHPKEIGGIVFLLDSR
jgi:hypothetical protein